MHDAARRDVFRIPGVFQGGKPALLAVTWCIAVSLVLLVLFGARGFDDPYITYRYAANLASGQGFVYNAGEYVLSTTSPLYALLLSVLGWIGFDIPWASNVLGCLSLGVGAWALWSLLRQWHWHAGAAVALLLYPLSPLLILTVGLETTLGLALIMLAFLAYERQQFIGAATLFALATLIRFDAVLAIAVAVGFDLISRHQMPPWRAVFTYVALLGPWLLFSTAYFGSALPATLAAKRQQATLPQSQSFLEGMAPFFAHYWSMPLFWLHLACALLGACAVFVLFRRSVMVLGWIVSYGLGYVLLGVTRYAWYYAPLVAGLMLLIALGVQACFVLLRKRWGPRIAWQGAAALGVVLLLGQVSSLMAYYRVENGRLRIYREVGTWFRNHTEVDASIGVLEVGIIGYYSERRIIDFAGLLQPETAAQFSPTSSYEDAALWSAQRFKPRYVLLHDGHFPRLETLLAERGGCRRLNDWSDPHYTSVLVAYGCTWQ